MNIRILRRLLYRRDGSAAVEAAMFVPIFMVLTFGITDLGSQMYIRQLVNAAAQAGASYAVIHSTGDCATLSGTCQSGIETAMNAAAGNASFCTDAGCDASIAGCTADGSPKCILVTASYALTPILPEALYSWATSMTVSYTVTVRIL